MSKSLPGRFPLHKLNRKETRKKEQSKLTQRGRRAGRGEKGISRRGAS